MDKLPYNIGRSLRIFNPKISTPSGFVADVSQTARGWKRSIRRNGGYWRGSFSLVDESGTGAMRLADFFFERLGCHFEERTGGEKTWEGMIYEMDLSIGDTTWRKTLDLLYNYVTTKYNDENDKSQTSDPVYNQGSMNKYGRREEIMLLDNFPQDTAEAQRDSYLKEHAWPWDRNAGSNGRPSEFPTLTVVVCGYIFTTNWRYTTITGGMEDVSTVIESIVTTDMELIQKGSIETNILQVNQTLKIPSRAFDLIQFYLELGGRKIEGEALSIYRAYVDNERRFYYRTVDPADVQYYVRGGKVYNSAGGSQEANYWQVKPAVFRSMDYPGSKSEYNPWFSDARDSFVDEVVFGDGMEIPVLKTAYFDETAILAAQAQYEQELEREKEAKRRAK